MIGHGGSLFLWKLLDREIGKQIDNLKKEDVKLLETVVWSDRGGFFLSTDLVMKLFKI